MSVNKPASFRYSMIVNQKLSFAKIQNEAASILMSQEEPTIDARLKAHAHLDGSVSALKAALVYFIAEVADATDARKFSQDIEPRLNCESLETLLTLANEKFSNLQQLQELQNLLTSENSWLYQLNFIVQDPTALATLLSHVAEQKNNSSSPMIQALNVSSHQENIFAEEFSITNLLRDHSTISDVMKFFLRETHGLIDRFRASLEEY